jgi:tetratricopeptide (TPR) repeat protein
MALHALDFHPLDPDVQEKRFDLHARRGWSFFQVGQWALAKKEFEAALSFLELRREVKRCELLVSLAETSFWLMDVPGVRRFASEAQRLAGRVGRDDLWADALAWMASAQNADGDVLGAIETDRRALARVGGIRSFGLARAPLSLYWAGRTKEAVEKAAEAVEHARTSEDPAFLLYSLQHLGLSLSGAGRYDEALRAFDEARTFGRRCGALPLLARATSMSVAPLLSLGDLEGAATRAFEARELAHRVAFEPPLVSAGIDLLLICARSHDPGRSEALLDEIARAVEKASGWHAWKWRLRLWQARAELALVRGRRSEAIIAAGNVVDQSRARSRLKYEALGLATRARAGRAESPQAVDDARTATEIARRLGDPAVLLECLAVLLELEGNDELLAEARQVVQRILEGLSQESLRRQFLANVASKVGAFASRLPTWQHA